MALEPPEVRHSRIVQFATKLKRDGPQRGVAAAAWRALSGSLRRGPHSLRAVAVALRAAPGCQRVRLLCLLPRVRPPIDDSVWQTTY